MRTGIGQSDRLPPLRPPQLVHPRSRRFCRPPRCRRIAVERFFHGGVGWQFDLWTEIGELKRKKKWKPLLSMPAEQQVEAVVKKLVELNPGFGGKVKPVFPNGEVIDLGFLTDEITDISPVRAFPGLMRLRCNGGNRTGKLVDLSPLKGLPLTFLEMQKTQVADLSPLQGMLLNYLACADTNVADLSPLKDMPLKDLRINFKPERDTDVLRSLKTLEMINGKPVAEFWKDVEKK